MGGTDRMKRRNIPGNRFPRRLLLLRRFDGKGRRGGNQGQPYDMTGSDVLTVAHPGGLLIDRERQQFAQIDRRQRASLR